MGKVIAVIVVVLLVIGGFYLFRGGTPATRYNTGNEAGEYSQSPATSSQSATSTQAATVSYTNSGFSPKTVTIKKGQSVTFTNQSSTTMWVASNPHPQHTDYPGFDEKAAVGRGGSWSFTFDKTGNWGYHNHRNTYDTGTVIVQ